MSCVKNLEEWFENYHYTKPGSASAVNSGTSALILALKAVFNKTTKREVITTPFTFQATSDAIILAGGIPIFADIEEHSHLISIESIFTRFSPEKTAAVLPVHLFGRVFNTDKLKKQLNGYNTYIIEDACQSVLHPSLKYFDGDIICYSFNASKNLQCGEGGMVISNKFGKVIKALSNNGRVNGEFQYIGYNFRMSEYQAIVAYNQLVHQREQIIAGLGKKSERNGYYSRLTYQHPEYERLGLVGYCPVAEKVARQISESKYE